MKVGGYEFFVIDGQVSNETVTIKLRGGAVENPNPEKVAVVEEVERRLTEAESVVVTEYRGLTVDQLAELRGALRPVGGSYKIYKNTLVRRAATQANVDIAEHLTGPTALALTETTPDGNPGDVVTVAKALRDFAKENPELVIKGGIYEGNVLTVEDLQALADVEPREVLLAKFAGLLQAPMSQFARLMQAVPQNFAYGLQALVDQKGGAPEASTEEAVAADVEATEETPADADTSTEETPADADTSADAEVTETKDAPEPESEA